MRGTALALCLLGWLAGPALAADTPAPDPVQHNRDILAASQADGVFTVQDDGTIRHLQSGMICPATYPNVTLWHLEVFPNDAGKGVDVACDYGRNGPDGNWIAKLTLFATIAPAGWKLDDVFANYRGEVLQANPGVVSLGPALEAKGDTAKIGEWRSEEFSQVRDGREFTTSLVVALRGKWMFEVRSTYLGKPNDIGGGSDPNDAVLAAGDRAMTAKSFLDVVQTLQE